MKNKKSCSIFIENNIWDTFRGLDFERSPIRYPGGKTRGVPTILSVLPDDISYIVSPFLGGGSVEVALDSYGFSVHCYDVFDRLVNFWNCLKKDPNHLANLARKFLPGSRDIFYELKSRKYRKGFPCAAEFLFVNRSSFSGLTYSGGYSKSSNEQKFTPKYLDFISNYRTNIHINYDSFEQSITQHPHDFLYLDPPYLLEESNNKLYGQTGNTHSSFDHDKLKDLLRNHKWNWVMSYNNDPVVKDLYAGYQMVECGWGYSMRIGKDALGKNKGEKRELLIFSPGYHEVKSRSID